MIAIHLSKQQVLDADPKAMQQIHFMGNLDKPEKITMLLIIEEVKEIIYIFHKELLEHCKCIYFNIISV